MVIYCNFKNDNYFSQHNYVSINELNNINKKDIIKLNITETNLNVLPDLSSYINLQCLICSYNELTELPDLSKCINLELLYCENNKLIKLPDLSKCVKLKLLYCSNNKLTTLSNLSKCINLQILSCYNNKLVEINSLENLNNLEHLFLNNNLLIKIPIFKYKNIKYLFLNNNKINDIDKINIISNYCVKMIYKCYNKFNTYKYNINTSFIINNFIKKYYYLHIINYYKHF